MFTVPLRWVESMFVESLGMVMLNSVVVDYWIRIGVFFQEAFTKSTRL